MQLQGLRLQGLQASHDLASLDQCSTDSATEAVAMSLGASSVHIYVGGNAGEVQYKSILKKIFGIYTHCQQIDCFFKVHVR